MPAMLPTSGGRLLYVCEAGKPVCPRCGRRFRVVTIPTDGRAMLRCHRKCEGRAYAMGLDREYCLVIGVPMALWDRLVAAQHAQILRNLGVMVDDPEEAA